MQPSRNNRQSTKASPEQLVESIKAVLEQSSDMITRIGIINPKLDKLRLDTQELRNTLQELNGFSPDDHNSYSASQEKSIEAKKQLDEFREKYTRYSNELNISMGNLRLVEVLDSLTVLLGNSSVLLQDISLQHTYVSFDFDAQTREHQYLQRLIRMNTEREDRQEDRGSNSDWQDSKDPDDQTPLWDDPE